MKRKIVLIALLLTFISSDYSTVSQAYVSESTEVTINAVISPLADITEWRYKIEDGKLYKRLFNASKDVWIGPWILVG